MSFESNYSRIESLDLKNNTLEYYDGLNRTIVGLKVILSSTVSFILIVFESNYSRIERGEDENEDAENFNSLNRTIVGLKEGIGGLS